MRGQRRIYDSVEAENPEEAELLHNAVEISSIERPSTFLHRLAESAIDLRAFIKKGQRLGILESPKEDEIGSPSRQVAKLPPVPNFMRPQVATRLEEVSLYHVFGPGSYTLLLGAKGAEKTSLPFLPTGPYYGVTSHGRNFQGKPPTRASFLSMVRPRMTNISQTWNNTASRPSRGTVSSASPNLHLGYRNFAPILRSWTILSVKACASMFLSMSATF